MSINNSGRFVGDAVTLISGVEIVPEGMSPTTISASLFTLSTSTNATLGVSSTLSVSATLAGVRRSTITVSAMTLIMAVFICKYQKLLDYHYINIF